MAELLADHVVCHIAGRSRLAGDLHGTDDVLALLGRLAAVSDGTYTIRADDVLANDRHVVEIWVHAVDPYAADEFRELVAARSE